MFGYTRTDGRKYVCLFCTLLFLLFQRNLKGISKKKLIIMSGPLYTSM